VKRGDLIQAYINALPLRAILIYADKSGLSAKAALEPDPLDLFDTLWFSKLDHAELVLSQCPEGWVDLPPTALRDEVINAAAALGASFRTAAEIETEASKEVEEIIKRVEVMRLSGLLTKVNRDYKIYRQTQVARGLKAVPYQAHLDAFTLSLVKIAAESASAN